MSDNTPRPVRGSSATLLARALAQSPDAEEGCYGERGKRTLRCAQCGSTRLKLSSAGAYWQTLVTHHVFEGDHRIWHPHSVTETFDAHEPHTGAYIAWQCEQGHRSNLSVNVDEETGELTCVMLYEDISGPVTEVIVAETRPQ